MPAWRRRQLARQRKKHGIAPKPAKPPPVKVAPKKTSLGLPGAGRPVPVRKAK